MMYHVVPLLLLFAGICRTTLVEADVHTFRYATYNASSPLGPWTPSIVNEDWAIGGNISTPVWCIQNNPITTEAVNGQVGQAEDCLLLRIFRPDNYTAVADDDNGPLLPVMLWLHGGMFLLGSGASEDLYYGGWLANAENIIVISINYRLGAHGFLGYSGTYGNAINVGILDQKNAIEWTSRYVREFGGDSSRITLAGESAGATSVNIHMANAETNQLFEKAILESNPAGINLKVSSDQTTLFRKLAKKVNCAGHNDEALMECLVFVAQEEPDGMAKIINASSSVTYVNSLFHLDVWMSFYSWAPSVDNEYIFGQPNLVAVDTWPVSRDVLIGTNEDEARFFLSMICSILTAIADQLFLGGLFIKCDGGNLYDHTLYRNLIRLAYGLDIRKLDDYYKFVWFEDDEDMDDAIEQFSLLVTDSVFNCPNYDMASAIGIKNTKNVFFYRYAVDAICSVASEPEDCEGFSCHGDEIATVFGSYGVPAVSEIGNCTPDKVAALQPYVNAVQKHWGEFVRKGPEDIFFPWSFMKDASGPMFLFEQEYTNEGRIPAAGETVFTTHHTEQDSYTAQEVCVTWAEHAWKSEASGAVPGRLFGLGAIVVNGFVLFSVLLS